MLKDIPDEDLPTDKADFWYAVSCELMAMIRCASKARQPSMTLANYRKAGSQYIWEFWVNDLVIPQKDEYNWHSQNTSQWQYAGAILVQDGRVSTHH